MTQHRFRVERHMQGDKPYLPGDERNLNPGEAAHMVRSGALTDLGPIVEKADAPVENKAEPALDNKAEKPAARKAAKKEAKQ